MPELDKALFAGRDLVSLTDWTKLSTTDLNKSAVDEFLEGFGWDQQAAACVGVRLSPDNTRVLGARLALAGKWSENVELPAKRLWPDAPENLILAVELDNMSSFRFAEGELWSDMVGGDVLKKSFKTVVAGVEKLVELAEVRTMGIAPDGFVARAIGSIAKTSGGRYGVWLAVTILVYPIIEGEEMQAVALDPAWPGIKLSDGEVAILPPSGRGKSALNGKAWGCPIAPAIQPGSPWEAAPGPLASADVVTAIGALLNTGCIADACISFESMRKKWEKIKRAPGDLRRKKAEKSWPAVVVTAPVAQKGEKPRGRDE